MKYIKAQVNKPSKYRANVYIDVFAKSLTSAKRKIEKLLSRLYPAIDYFAVDGKLQSLEEVKRPEVDEEVDLINNEQDPYLKGIMKRKSDWPLRDPSRPNNPFE